jgi:hypothetical protein
MCFFLDSDNPDAPKTYEELAAFFAASSANLPKISIDDFDCDITGMNCVGWLDPDEQGSFTCPFSPGCGQKEGTACDLMLKYARILSPPQTRQ